VASAAVLQWPGNVVLHAGNQDLKMFIHVKKLIINRATLQACSPTRKMVLILRADNDKFCTDTPVLKYV